MPTAEAKAYVEDYLARASAAAAAKRRKPRGRPPVVADRPAFYRAPRESGGRHELTALVYSLLTDVAITPRQAKEFVERQKRGQ